MIEVAERASIPGAAFSTIAESYDAIFTDSIIGRSQRKSIWEKAAAVFRFGDRVLEMNCGTGEDALFLAGRGIRVVACDASPGMIERARTRKAAEAPFADVSFHLLPTERLWKLGSDRLFDGAFSNFSGLNCVQDLAAVGRELALRVKAGGSLLICLSTRYCIWEILHYSCRGQLRKGFRRWTGSTEGTLGDYSFPVYYPTARSLTTLLSPMFRLRSIRGIGIAVPPTYMEEWACKNPRMFCLCEAADRVLRDRRGFRIAGDHMLLHLEKV